MATYTKAIDLYRDQIKLLEKHKMSQEKGIKMLGSLAKKDLEELLSGKYTKSQTRGAFARGASPSESTPTGRRRDLTARKMRIRNLPGSIPLNPINEQSGKLRRRIRVVTQEGRVLKVSLLIRDVEYAKYVLAIGGTKKMVARGIQKELQRRITPRNRAFLKHYLDI